MKYIKIILILILLSLLGYFSYISFRLLEEKPAINNIEDPFLYIPSNSNLESVYENIKSDPALNQLRYVEKAAQILGYNDARVKAGRFRLPDHISAWRLIKLLKSGEQAPLNVVLNNERTIEELAGKVSKYLEADSLEFLNSFEDTEVLNELELVSERLMCIMIPNTYQFFWNTSPAEFLKRMKREHQKFWEKDERLSKAEKLGLSTDEVYILASVVEKESQVKSERPDIAGLYLNRLKENMKLQADPTVVYALGDFTINRVLYEHLFFDSPYNTYLYEGLPPGPISMSSINSIDAVLNANNHDYLYMCAKPDLSGGHLFASTYQQHLKNAAVYRKWLDNYLRTKNN
jgi:UPF0755 protein